MSMTQEEILQLINTVVAANAESQKEFARELAQQIANPPKTEEELKAQKVLWEARCEAASMDEAARARKRDFCVPSMTDRPHRRPMNIFQGLHAGQSVIVWKMTQYSSRDPETKQTLLSNPTPVGVCQWCLTEFKPGDPDYAEALSWGTNQMAHKADMNVHTGDWA